MRRWFRDLDRILRGEATQMASLDRGVIDVSVRGLVFVLVLLSMAYGLCMGTFALAKEGGPNYIQAVASMVKLPALFFLTLLVTLPSLYVTNALVGSRLTPQSVVRLLVSGLGVMIAVLASVGPIIAFFSVSTTSYPFMLLTNVAVFAGAGALGLKFLLQTLQRLSDAPRVRPPGPMPSPHPAYEPGEGKAIEGPKLPLHRDDVPGALDRPDGQVLGRDVRIIFRLWIVLFGLVGAQMGWVLRPFLGNPNQPFTWFRARESNFFQGVWVALQSLFS